MAAAIKQVFDGGKAVIHLPYSALMSDIANKFAALSNFDHEIEGIVVRASKVVTVELDVRVEGTSMVYGGSFFINYDGRLREIKWTIWRGKANDGVIAQHEKSDIFQNADIVLATPDKWACPARGKQNFNCDTFVSRGKFEKFTLHNVLLIIDEAHQFEGLLGGNECEMLKRMTRLIKCRNAEHTVRVLLASATLGKDEEDANEFAKQLTGRTDDLEVFQPSALKRLVLLTSKHHLRTKKRRP